jgi:hypothetical protein
MFGMGKPAKADQGERPQAHQERVPARKPARAAVTVQLTAAERDKFERLGGGEWLRRQIASADEQEE